MLVPKINPKCRDVLYLKGTIYNALGETLEAIDCYIGILDTVNINDPLFNCSGNEDHKVDTLINDSYFQLYRLFYDLKKFELSNRFLEEYKKGIEYGIDTLYKPLDKFLMH